MGIASRAFVLSVTLFISTSLFSARRGEAQDIKADKIQRLRQALRNERQNPQPRHPPLKSEPVDMQRRALTELKPSESSYSKSSEPSIAVVYTQSLVVQDPVAYTGLQLGLTVQPYSPEGRVPLVTLGVRELSGAGDTWMPGLEASYLPWTSRLFGLHAVGLRTGVAYARQELALFAPTGVRLANTELHALQSYLLLSQAWSIAQSESWSMNADVGAARFDMLVTSGSSLGEASDNIWLGILRVGPSFHAWGFHFNLNYERRERLSSGGWARLAENGMSLGVLYGLR